MSHQPVLLKEFCEAVKKMPRKVENYLDCTFGRGGHFDCLLELYPNLQADLIDQDLEAIDYGKNKYEALFNKGQIRFHHMNFMNFKNEANEELNNKKFDLILADLGLSSPQLDTKERGFSFYNEGPLDMRMNPTKGPNASDIVNEWSEEDLIELFQEMGEVRRPQKVVKNIIDFRKEKPFVTTLELADLIAKSDGWRKKGTHPATKYFLALRMQVNDEIAPLEEAILDLIHRLKDQGQVMVITFHSMEDRIVKWAFKRNTELGKIITKKAIQPKWSEKKENPRARSAILRVFEKLKCEKIEMKEGER